MEKNCIYCGKALPEEASFCPYCMAPQQEQQAAKPLKRWRKKAVIALAAALALCLCAGLCLYAYQDSQRPKVYSVSDHMTYTVDGKSYDLLLGWSSPEEGQRIDCTTEREILIPADDVWMSFTHLCVYPADGSAELATDFLDHVESVSLSSMAEDDKEPFECFPPEQMDMWPYALYSANFAFSTECGESQLIWHLNMKNGDTISISHRATVVEKTE